MAQALPKDNLEVDVRVGAPPPDGYDSWESYFEEFVSFYEGPERADDQEAHRIGKAMRLAPTLQVFRALLSGQPVPVSALDPEWAARYGL